MSFVFVLGLAWPGLFKFIYGEMVAFGESNKTIKISGKMDKSKTYNKFSSDISFFIQGRTSD